MYYILKEEGTTALYIIHNRLSMWTDGWIDPGKKDRYCSCKFIMNFCPCCRHKLHLVTPVIPLTLFYRFLESCFLFSPILPENKQYWLLQYQTTTHDLSNLFEFNHVIDVELSLAAKIIETKNFDLWAFWIDMEGMIFLLNFSIYKKISMLC